MEKYEIDYRTDGHPIIDTDLKARFTKAAMCQRLNEQNGRIEELNAALESLVAIAQKCDGGESFPPGTLEKANSVLSCPLKSHK